MLRAEGDYTGAKAAFQRALTINEKVVGPDHPKVAISVNNLGGVLRAEGDYAGAKAAYQRALTILETTFGADHPNAKTVRRNLDELNENNG